MAFEISARPQSMSRPPAPTVPWDRVQPRVPATEALRAEVERQRSQEQPVWRRASPDVRRIITLAAKEHGIPVAEVVGRRQSKAVTAARVAAMIAIAEAKPHISSKDISRIFDRDHTTVLHHFKKHGVRQSEVRVVSRAQIGRMVEMIEAGTPAAAAAAMILGDQG